MKSILTSLLLVICFSSTAQDCEDSGSAQEELNVNNINALLRNSGDFWWGGPDVGRYITPSEGIEEVSAINTGALWIGGEDENGNLKLSAQQYRSVGKTDFYPGPLSDNSGAAFEDGCTNWDRFWIVNKSEVDAHILDLNDGSIDIQIENIYSWPGRNNPHFEPLLGFPIPENQKLAPFFDNDQDGNYNPDNGDFPLIKGDQSIWWVFNDNAGSHNYTNATPIEVEIHVLAYAFASDDNEDLNNATFYDFEIINKSKNSLNDGFIGLWVDFSLGCPDDDYIGYNEEYQMMYVYNEDVVDGIPGFSCGDIINTYGDNIPIVGIKKMDGEVNPVTSYSIQLWGGDNPAPVNPPNSDEEYYNFLKGLWGDGRAMTYGGSGFNPSSLDTTFYLYSGDPSEDEEWSLCTAYLPFATRVSLMSSAMPDLQPGQSTTASYAVIYADNIDYPCPSLDRLKEAADAVCDGLMTSNETSISMVNFTISPNPAMDFIKITSDNFLQSVKVIDLSGQVVLVENGRNEKVKTLDIGSLPPSIYLVSVQDDQGNVAVEKVLIR